MTIYWERCDLCGMHYPTRQCTLVAGLLVDVHCCLACPHWMNKCKNPAWKIELPARITTPKTRGVSTEERQKLMEELTSLLERKKP